MESSQKSTSHEPSRDRLAKITSFPFRRGSDNQAHLSAPNYTLRRVQIMFGGLRSGWDREQGQGSGVVLAESIIMCVLLGLSVYLKYALHYSSSGITV